jgi:WS/DGAT/MGAT family acyltransferase
MAPNATREGRFDRRMSPGEALMWNVEKDPWLNPSGASVSVLDGRIDFDVLEQWLRAAAAALPRLRQRVEHGMGRLTSPTWVPDPEFDFDHHYRRMELPAPGSERQLLDLVAKLHVEPYDRTRPLWQMIAINGVAGDRSAVMMKLHHTIADGYGMARMQERFMVRDPDQPPPEPVDLDALVALDCAAAEAQRRQDSGIGELGRLVTLPARVSRRLVAEGALASVDPVRLLDLARSARDVARMGVSQLHQPRRDGPPAGSTLWTGRSRHRRLELVRAPLGRARKAAKQLGGSLNDLFLAALASGAAAHHEARGESVSAFNASFVISTRDDSAEGGNSFTPVRVQLPGVPMAPDERIADIQAAVASQRSNISGGGLMGGFANVVNLLPTSVTTRAARRQSAKIDFATTNVRGSSRPLYIAGRPMIEIFAPGPVAGAAMIVSALSYVDTLSVLMTVDPVAIPEADALRDDVERAFDELLTAGSA